ncbi:MAG: hypothetical protein ACTSWQ_09105 [Candidatus Thorarchaeota archaeon]
MSDYDVKELISADAEWLRDRFKGKGKMLVNRTALIREIVLAELERCRTHGRPDEDRTLRNFWYSHIKSVLMRAEGLGAERENWGGQASQQLSAVMSDLVLRGIMKYSDIGIVDESRKVQRINSFELHPYDDVIVFVEKDTLFKPLQNVCNLYNVPFVSGAGYTATAAIEGVIEALSSFNQGQDHKYTVLVISDYDSYGFQIANDFQSRSLKLGLNCRVERIGVDPSHFDPAKMQTDMYPVSQKTAKDKQWARVFGIQGKYGLELDALVEADGSMQKLRDLLVDALETWCPEQIMFDAVRESTAEGADTEGTEWASDKILRDRKDPRYEVIGLMENLIEAVRDSLYKDQSKIEEVLIGYAQGMLAEEEFDDRDDPKEGTLTDAARKNSNYAWYNMERAPLSTKVETELVREHEDEIEEFETSEYKPLIDPLRVLADKLGVEYGNE